MAGKISLTAGKLKFDDWLSITAGSLVARILGMDKISHSTFFSSFPFPAKCSVQRVSISPCGKSLEYCHPPETLK